MELLPIEETPNTFEDYSIMTCNLPNEILEHIFAFLEVEDRKSVRLVCRLWYHCSTSSPITKKEKLAFKTKSSIEDITNMMLKSHFSIFNLDFRGVPVNRLPLDIWKECGNQIHSLTFDECDLNDEVIENVIVHCVNLKSLTFKDTTHLFRSKQGILCSPFLLDMIIENGIQRPKLHTFSAFIYNPSIQMLIVEKIFHVCPCIRHFTTEKISPYSISHLPISLKSLTFTRAYNATRDQECILMKALIGKAKQGSRLERFSGKFAGMDSFTKETLLNLFSLQETLNAIKIKLHKWDPCSSGDADHSTTRTHMKEIFFHILKSCPSLQEICFESKYYFLTFKWNECPQFLSSISKLQSLHLDLCVCSDGQNSSSESHLPSVLTPSKNLFLTTLELNFSAVDYSKEQDQLCAALFQHCPHLLHLKLCNSSDSTLLMVFKYLLKLQTLILCYDENYIFCDNCGFTSHDDSTAAEGYSIKQLQQLKSFGISSVDNWESLKPLTERIMLEIQSPHIEFLELNLDFLLSLEDKLIYRLSSQVPKLKFLFLRFGDRVLSSRFEECRKVPQFCRSLKNLRCMHIDPLDDQDPSIIQDIFRACPTIKYITDSRCYAFFFDPITSKIQCNEDLPKFTCILKPKVYDIFPRIIKYYIPVHMK